MEHVRRERYEPARETLLKAVEVNPKGHVSLYALGGGSIPSQTVLACVRVATQSDSVGVEFA
jgi:hypothetical protein